MLRAMLPLAWLLVFFTGCGVQESPSIKSPTVPPPKTQKSAADNQSAPEQQPVGEERLARANKPSKLPSWFEGFLSKQGTTSATEGKTEATRPGANMPAYHWPPDFKLPLVIHIDAPEVPKEIMGPSPPIKEEKRPAAKPDMKRPDEKE